MLERCVCYGPPGEQCEAGLLSVTGTPETPCKAGISAAGIAAGMYSYSGILTAPYERERTGRLQLGGVAARRTG